jgi:hypothetical protein
MNDWITTGHNSVLEYSVERHNREVRLHLHVLAEHLPNGDVVFRPHVLIEASKLEDYPDLLSAHRAAARLAAFACQEVLHELDV